MWGGSCLLGRFPGRERMMCHILASPFWVCRARSTELALLWSLDTTHAPSPLLESGTSASLPEALGVFAVFWRALDNSQKDAILSLPGQGMGTAHCPENLGMAGLLRPSSSGSAQPGELVHFSPKSLHICETWVCLLRKISFPAEGWQCPCRVGVGLQYSMVPMLHPLPQTLAA